MLHMRGGGFRERQGLFLSDKISNQDGHLKFTVSGSGSLLGEVKVCLIVVLMG